MTRIRIGTVGYTNALPLTRHLDPQRYEVVADHPRGISEALRTGDVAVALAPVAAVLTDDDYKIVPGWCIGADGAVHSVLLVAETPPEQWTEVVLDGESRTSVLLAQVLLREGPLADRLTGALPVRTVDPGAGVQAARGTTAAVVIGDAARALPERLTTRIDLAEVWKQHTGKPFVFAVWAARTGLDPQVIADLRAAGARGVAEIDSAYQGDDLVYLRDFIRYPLDEPALIGLRRFAAVAHRMGLLPREAIDLHGPEAPARVPPMRVLAALADAADGVLPSDEIARAWLTQVPDADLHTAAHMRRVALHGATDVTYLTADAASLEDWVQAADAAAVASRSALWIPELASASDDVVVEVLDGLAMRGLQLAGLPVAGRSAEALARFAKHGLTVVSWRSGGALEGVREAGLALQAVVDAGADDLVGALAAVRAAGDLVTAVRVELPLPAGGLVQPGHATPARFLRAVALARLLLPAVSHVVATPGRQGSDSAQAALFVGANDYGRVGDGAGPCDAHARFEVDVEEAERVLRVVGLEPVRRDVAHARLGGPLTKLRRIRRPEERATL